MPTSLKAILSRGPALSRRARGPAQAAPSVAGRGAPPGYRGATRGRAAAGQRATGGSHGVTAHGAAECGGDGFAPACFPHQPSARLLRRSSYLTRVRPRFSLRPRDPHAADRSTAQSQFRLRPDRQAAGMVAWPAWRARCWGDRIGLRRRRRGLLEVIERSRAHPGHSRRLSDRHPARLGHRRIRVRDVEPAGRARGRRGGVRELRRRLADRHRKAAEARRCARADRPLWRAAGPRPGGSCARHRVLLERHHLGRPDARTAHGSPTIARASPCATPPRPRSPWSCPGPSSMS